MPKCAFSEGSTGATGRTRGPAPTAETRVLVNQPASDHCVPDLLVSEERRHNPAIRGQCFQIGGAAARAVARSPAGVGAEPRPRDSTERASELGGFQRSSQRSSSSGVAMVHGVPGPAPKVEKREQFAGLIARGVSNREACRIVGVNRRTGTRWRYGRSITGSSGWLSLTWLGSSKTTLPRPPPPSRGPCSASTPGQ